MTRWYEMETHDRKTTCYNYYIPQTKENISLVLGNISQKYALCYYQLKVGYGTIGTFLVRIGIIKTLEYW